MFVNFYRSPQEDCIATLRELHPVVQTMTKLLEATLLDVSERHRQKKSTSFAAAPSVEVTKGGSSVFLLFAIRGFFPAPIGMMSPTDRTSVAGIGILQQKVERTGERACASLGLTGRHYQVVVVVCLGGFA